MKCNECKKEMEEGFLESRDVIYWTKEAKPIISAVYKDNVIIGKNNLLSVKGNSIKAYICKDCKKVIFNYK